MIAKAAKGRFPYPHRTLEEVDMSFDPSGIAKRARVNDIITLAAHLFAVPSAQITGKQRNRRFVRARFAIAAIAQEQGHSYPMIGRAMCRDHSTVIYGCRQATMLAAQEPVFAAQVEKLRDLAKRAKPFVSDRAAA